MEQSDILGTLKGGLGLAGKLAGKGLGEVSGLFKGRDEGGPFGGSGLYWQRRPASTAGGLVPALERLLSTSFLPASVYVISRLPSDPQWGDIVPIAVVSLGLAFVATLYPSWRASRVQPAEALRHE